MWPRFVLQMPVIFFHYVFNEVMSSAILDQALTEKLFAPFFYRYRPVLVKSFFIIIFTKKYYYSKTNGRLNFIDRSAVILF